MKVAVIGPGFVRAGYIGNHVRAFHEVGVVCKLAAPGRDYCPQQPVHTAPGLEMYQFRAEKGLPWHPSDWRLLSYLVAWADLVHVYHTAFPVSDLAAVVAKAYRKPLVVTTTDHVVYKRAWYRLGSHLAWFLSNRVVAFSERERRWLLSKGVADTKIQVIPLGIECERFLEHYRRRKHLREGGDRARILFVGRKHPDKNLERLLYSVQRAAEESTTPLHLTLVGGVPKPRYAARLKALIAQLDMADIVDFVTEVRDEEAFLDYYARSHVFIDLALYGTFEVVVLEAMAVRLPVIVSERVGAAEVVAQERAGIVVNPEREKSITEAILALVEHPERREELSQCSQQVVCERYSYHNMVRRLQALYEEVIGG